MIEIRPESPQDTDAIQHLTIDAFTQSEFGHQGEAELIEKLRHLQGTQSWVAVDDEMVVGHVLFSTAAICCAKGQLQGMALGPISVSPSRQGQGIGRQLIEAGLSAIDDSNAPFVIVAGAPELYTKFGFVPAIRFGVRHAFREMPQDVFFIRTREPKKICQLGPGLAYYAEAFGPQQG